MDKITGLIELLGEENNKKIKDKVAQFIIDAVEDDIRDYDRGNYILNPEEIIDFVNECKEEAKIFIKNPIYICTYEKEYKNKDYANELPFQYSAYLTHLYIATYNGKYNGFINEYDLDNDMYKYGKFYDIDKVSNILLDEHKFALSTIMNKDLSAIIESLLI